MTLDRCNCQSKFEVKRSKVKGHLPAVRACYVQTEMKESMTKEAQNETDASEDTDRDLISEST